MKSNTNVLGKAVIELHCNAKKVLEKKKEEISLSVLKHSQRWKSLKRFSKVWMKQIVIIFDVFSKIVETESIPSIKLKIIAMPYWNSFTQNI